MFFILSVQGIWLFMYELLIKFKIGFLGGGWSYFISRDTSKLATFNCFTEE